MGERPDEEVVNLMVIMMLRKWYHTMPRVVGMDAGVERWNTSCGSVAYAKYRAFGCSCPFLSLHLPTEEGYSMALGPDFSILFLPNGHLCLPRLHLPNMSGT